MSYIKPCGTISYNKLITSTRGSFRSRDPNIINTINTWNNVLSRIYSRHQNFNVQYVDTFI